MTTTPSSNKSSTSIIRLDNLSLGYSSHHPIIQNLSIDIKHGDFVCVVGANGSGKSTLVKGILGLLKPLSGKVIFCKDLKNTSIGYLPQEVKVNQNFPATVLEIVLSGTLGRLRLRPFYSPKEYKASQKALETLDIAELANESFINLSGGQKQKVLLARALVATKELLILDEPSNNLDPASRKEFYHLLTKLNHDHLTIIMITHDVDVTDLVGNKVLSIEKGNGKLTSTSAYLRSIRQ